MRLALILILLAGCDLVLLGDRPTADTAPDAAAMTGDAVGDRLRFVQTPRTPLEAQNDCMTRGERLIEIRTPAENARASSLTDQPFAIALFDYDEDDTFRWASNAEPMAYRNFYTNQPDDANHTQSCVLVMQGGFWFDYACTPMPYICEVLP